MAEPNIVLCRIDNRLVHGQVGVTWLSFCKANLIIIADDEVAHDEVQQQIMKMTANYYNVQIRFFTVQHTADIIYKAASSQKIFIVTKTPIEMLELIEKGVPIKEVNVGNMHFSQGKKQVSSRVYADEEELEALKKIKEKVDKLYFQDVPTKEVEQVNL